MTSDREVADTPRHFGQVPRERANVSKHSGGRSDGGVRDAQAGTLELLDREGNVEVVVNRSLER
jgi:hypothetical protein